MILSMFDLLSLLLLFAAIWLLIDLIFDEDDKIVFWRDEPTDILDRRLAEGDITVAEYKKRKQALGPTD